MKVKKAFHLALNLLMHSKLRSWLTIIGIIIGIASVVSIMAISQGAQKQLEERLNSLGADIITVSPGFSRAMGGGGSFREPEGGGGSSATSTQKNLTSKDVLVLKNTQNVEYVMGTVSAKVDMSYLGKTATVSMTGVDEDVWKYITTDKILSGRFLTQGDAYSAVLGGNLVKNTFEGKITLNNKITLEGRSFTVVGILEEGNNAYIPVDVARDISDDIGEKEFNSIQVKIADVQISNDTVNDMTKRLMLSRGILKEKDRDFSVSNPRAFQETMLATIQTASLFLGAIAAISLIVGAIGIANTMFTSVLERTRDIGIMKALGAKNWEILLIFLLNSGLIGLVGGVGGILLGTAVSTTISSMAGVTSGGGGRGGPMGMMMFGSSSNVTLSIVLIALFFSVVVGMIAGAIPAYKASKLNPVDALRYE